MGEKFSAERKRKGEVAAERWLIQIVKLMYDKTDWCCRSDASELRIAKRRQITTDTVWHAASSTK